MKQSRKGDWYYVATKPSRKSRNKFLQKVKEWCVENRHCQAMHLFFSFFKRLIASVRGLLKYGKVVRSPGNFSEW
jgi:hypothetical protein